MTIDGMEVKDATKDYDLNITKPDIEKAVKQHNACCAAAICAMRDPAVEKVRIGLSVSYIKFTKDNFWLRYQTPRHLYVNIVTLDRGGQFMPGQYYLAKMPNSETKRRGKAHTERPSKHPRPYQTTRRPHYVLAGVRNRIDRGTGKGSAAAA